MTPTVAPARYVLIELAATVTGYTAKAIEKKIERGDWREGKEWRRAQDGHILIDLEGYNKWVESQPAGARPRKARTGSNSTSGTASGATAPR